MNLRMVGCTHHEAGIDVRQRLAFDDDQARSALAQWHSKLPGVELALLATCNRVELYAAGKGSADPPAADDLIDLLLDHQGVARQQVEGQLRTLEDNQVVAHLYRVAASLESMVVGEPQILAQVKQAYQITQEAASAGPMLHGLFQSALRTAKRVASETALHKHRVSIASVAISELASCLFETFDRKHVLVIGSGEMADETIRYLRDVGDARIHVVNRNEARGRELAAKWAGQYHRWEALWDQLVQADLAISTTAASESIITALDFERRVVAQRHQRPLFLLDLAVPRDIDPLVGDALGVYLYSLDDLGRACQRNRAARAAELPAAERIVSEETVRFTAEFHRRAAAPVISGLRRGLEQSKATELERLFQKLPDLDQPSRQEIGQFADRLVNKMLHPPMESLRDASRNGTPHHLLDALQRLFRLED